MKKLPNLSRATRFVAVIALSLSVAGLFTGCVSNKYKKAKSGTPLPQLLNVAFAPAPLEATLNSVITYNGPGSWKRDAFWDEYVVTLHNPGSQPLTVATAGLTDFAGLARTAGGEPWALEKVSKTLEQKYKDAGMAFVRYTAPGLLIVGTGTAAAASAGFLTAGAGAAGAAIVVALPIYYIGVVVINHRNKAAMSGEFNRRRHAPSLTLAPGETRTGSFFFPMVPSPRSLGLRWSTATASGESVLPLDFLHSLHVNSIATAAAK
jgi:hypothetical protein